MLDMLKCKTHRRHSAKEMHLDLTAEKEIEMFSVFSLKAKGKVLSLAP